MSELQKQLQELLDRSFKIEQELGGGGMSRVFLAEERELGRRVVIKVLPPELAAGVSTERFRREVQLAASLQHPHVVPVHAAGRVGDLLYYTMPMIEGESLRARLEREEVLPVSEVTRILRDVLDALSYAHTHGVVHRDIKPDNVLVSGRHAVVTDFGVAKALSEATGQSSLTSAGVALGTPSYMSPEQAAADPHTDHRADIYAVGALAYEMLTGRPPFTGAPQVVLSAQITRTPQPLTELRPTVPPALAGVVMRCLEKKPADRWQSAEEMLHQLEALTTPSGGMTPAGSAPITAVARMPRAVQAAALALGVLVIGAGVWLLVGNRKPSGATSGGTASEPIGLVVLPFENLGSPEDAYFADGITEEVTSRLARLQGLAVVARSSANQYRGTTKTVGEIGGELDVGYVLQGTVRWEKSGNTSRVRVSPQLVHVSDARNVWAEPYEADLAGVFQLQADIAERVAQALSIRLLASGQAGAGPDRPTQNLEAYDAYLRGSELSVRSENEADTRAAIGLYERAVMLDPSFALAFAKLSRSHALMYLLYYDRTEQRLAEARRAVDQARALGPALPEVAVATSFLSGVGQAAAPSAPTGRPGGLRPRPGMIGQ